VCERDKERELGKKGRGWGGAGRGDRGKGRGLLPFGALDIYTYSERRRYTDGYVFTMWIRR